MVLSMLNQLSIKNVAVIDSLEVDIKPGLSVLTGETGAGKSIIIDSINMILGDRSNKELVRYGTDKAVVQAVFDTNSEAEEFLQENDIDYSDSEIIITRTITKDGKSTARINGTVVTLAALRELTANLINIHGQHDNQALLMPAKHLLFLDKFGKTTNILDEYRAVYYKMKTVASELNNLEKNEQNKMQRMDLLQYQIKEIDSANLIPGEEEELLTQRDICLNAEKIASSVDEAYSALYENGQLPSAYDGISVAVDALSQIHDLSDRIENILESLTEAMYSVEDGARELISFRDTVDFDEKTLNEVEDRLEIISRLKRKYGRSIGEILKFRDNAKKELDKIVMSDEYSDKLKSELDKLKSELSKLGSELSKARRCAAKNLEQGIESALHELNMEKSKFHVEINKDDKFNENGIDRVEFVISTNPGEPMKPLVKIASGGELSRVMLAIKSILAESDSVDTMIFDEIDTGVSGATAAKIAGKLTDISKSKQVICITHLPQLTAASDNHYLIQKDTDSDMAYTTLKELDYNGRISELARIIDGEKITEAAINHAKELLKRG